jgi:ADP-ribose pyrophosphatase YjhB (NUDIX family)
MPEEAMKAFQVPFKRAIGVFIRNGDHILSLRRPDDDDELPGVWGLPAGSFRGNETSEQLIRRIGREKLDVVLSPLRKLADGTRPRSAYLLEMHLWEVAMAGTPARGDWEWAPVERLQPGIAAGSLCCALALKAAGEI